MKNEWNQLSKFKNITRSGLNFLNSSVYMYAFVCNHKQLKYVKITRIYRMFQSSSTIAKKTLNR